MSIREEQCNKVCRILDDVLANRTTERDSLIIAVRKAFESLEQLGNSEQLPSVQQERKWIPCSNPPKHHKDVIVRGIEAIGNVTVHKVMQWDVDTWRPTDYAPSVMWKEWSEI